jgi:hypothetical protein
MMILGIEMCCYVSFKWDVIILKQCDCLISAAASQAPFLTENDQQTDGQVTQPSNEGGNVYPITSACGYHHIYLMCWDILAVYESHSKSLA